MNDELYSKIKIEVVFIPDSNCDLQLRYRIIQKYRCDIVVRNDGFQYFEPEKLTHFAYGGMIPVKDQICGEVSMFNIQIPANLLNKFIFDKLSKYPAWFGYFNSRFSATKELKIHTKKEMIQHLESIYSLTDDVKRQISELKFI